ncbi:MAG: alcohol dehydrogenase [Candidatus Binatus sp.]|jgi:D-arabinose 1-dehydrogenase-like Zn-dependent alcohol dehydrogenase|uniref:alcohol dehydrogenase n=1 Tax=Candidatus Binatus sp. TaxID=2811406 RepID=UPI003C724DAD
MKSVRVEQPKGPFKLVDEKIVEPAREQVRIRVQACGICHSDMFTKEGAWPGITYPRSPGHEIAGVIDALGEDLGDWKVGDRVGVGWHGGNCFRCDPCRRGDFVNCKFLKIPGISYDGGYTAHVIAPVEALAHIPDVLRPEEAAPLMCAGITTFNALRHSGAGPGDLVGIQGIGGLGHLGIQFAAKSGYDVVAIGRGEDKEPLALKLGARRYIDGSKQDVAAELNKDGGATVILVTAPDSKAIGALVDGLGVRGRLVIVGASPEPFAVSSIQLISLQRTILGWPAGTSKDSEDTLKFAAQTGVRAMIETFPIERAAEGYERMMTGKVRFRAVLMH